MKNKQLMSKRNAWAHMIREALDGMRKGPSDDDKRRVLRDLRLNTERDLKGVQKKLTDQI